MNGWSALDRFPRTDPRDVGCEQAMEMLSIYVELVAIDAPAEQRYPGIAAHFRSCGPCGEDFEGLLAASRDALTATPCCPRRWPDHNHSWSAHRWADRHARFRR
jgi:hypothetical protein